MSEAEKVDKLKSEYFRALVKAAELSQQAADAMREAADAEARAVALMCEYASLKQYGLYHKQPVKALPLPKHLIVEH